MSRSFDDAEMSSLETSLARLRPRAPGLSRERLLFAAGRATAPPLRHAWAGTALASLAALVLGCLLVTRPPTVLVEERVVVRVKEVPAAPVAGPSAQASPESAGFEPQADVLARAPRGSYLGLRDEMLRWGIDVLPCSAVSVALDSPLTPADLLVQTHPQPRSSLVP